MKKKRKSQKSALSRIKSSLLKCTKLGKGLYLRPHKQTDEGVKRKKKR